MQIALQQGGEPETIRVVGEIGILQKYVRANAETRSLEEKLYQMGNMMEGVTVAPNQLESRKIKRKDGAKRQIE